MMCQAQAVAVARLPSSTPRQRPYSYLIALTTLADSRPLIQLLTVSTTSSRRNDDVYWNVGRGYIALPHLPGLH